MNIFIHGTGLVSALGRGWPLEGVEPQPVFEEIAGLRLPSLRVPTGATADVDGIPRLRRSGDLSRFAVAAACDAVAGCDPALLAGLPVIFATTDGGVCHTTRFFAPIEASGCGNGSPILFPETVYNAPASHIAARLGSHAEATTMVGDSSAGLAAVCAACDLISAGTAPAVLVVAANECDPLACLAYSRRGICADSAASPLPILTEGAAAVLLGTEPGPAARVEAWSEGPPASSPQAALSVLERLADSLRPARAEQPVILAHAPGVFGLPAPFPTSKKLPGEGHAFTDLAQLVVEIGGDTPIPDLLLLSLGFHGQNAGLRLTQRYATP